MATWTPTELTNEGASLAFAATSPTGDTILYSGGILVIEFDNTAGAAQTVTIAAQDDTVIVPGVGEMNVPARTLSIPATIGTGIFVFEPATINSYTANGKMALTYSPGSVSLLMRVFKIAP